jgi:hypothetical protein
MEWNHLGGYYNQGLEQIFIPDDYLGPRYEGLAKSEKNYNKLNFRPKIRSW